MRLRPIRALTTFLLLTVAAFGSGCTATGDGPSTTADGAHDPWESFNRASFEVNLALDKAVIKPAAYVFRETVPDPGRLALHNFLNNLRAPIIFANDLAQGELERASVTFWRFMVNSSFGFLGIADPAREMGFPHHEEDFGQTFAVWGMKSGPFLMVPLLGPSNPRDLAGQILGLVLDPFRIIVTANDAGELQIARSFSQAVDFRSRNYDEINDLERDSLDFYATTRSLYRQRRADEIRNGRPDVVVPTPGISAAPDMPATQQTGSAK